MPFGRLELVMPQERAVVVPAKIPSVLYISYDGLLEPLGQSQVLQYLAALAHHHQIALMTFEKPHDWNDVELRQTIGSRAAREGIAWKALRYHKRPSLLATAFDIIHGFFVAALIVRRQRVQIVHARSYVPAVIALALKNLFGVKFIFDMRGFWPDEKVEGGSWGCNSVGYRIAKWFERRFLTRADVVVSLTRSGVSVMSQIPYLQGKLPRFEVVTTCANGQKFQSGPVITSSAAEKPFVIGMVGSVGLWYMLDEMIAAFEEFRRLRPGSQLLALNRDAHEFIRERLEHARVPPAAYEVKSVKFDDVPAEMAKMSAAVFFIRPVSSKRASAPTKFGELLASGVPCLVNKGVGDLDEIVNAENIGVVIDNFGPDSIRAGVQDMIKLLQDPELRPRCVAAAVRHYSLEQGVRSYHRIYRSLV